MKNEATPGPWEYRDRMVLGGPEATYVCEVSGAASNPEHQADARLIAAAPDLLAALEACESQLSDDYQGTARGYWPTIAPVLEQARAAIAKAKGR